MKYLRYEHALDSPVYGRLVNVCVDLLTGDGPGVFSKQQVMEDAQLDVLDDGVIRWDYVKRMIEEQFNTELIPLASTFFKRSKGDRPPEQFPGTYIANGHGKKTVGFCIASQRNGHFVIEALKLKRGKAKGIAQRHDAVVQIGRTAEVSNLPDPMIPKPAGPRLIE